MVKFASVELFHTTCMLFMHADYFQLYLALLKVVDECANHEFTIVKTKLCTNSVQKSLLKVEIIHLQVFQKLVESGPDAVGNYHKVHAYYMYPCMHI